MYIYMIHIHIHIHIYICIYIHIHMYLFSYDPLNYPLTINTCSFVAWRLIFWMVSTLCVFALKPAPAWKTSFFVIMTCTQIHIFHDLKVKSPTWESWESPPKNQQKTDMNIIWSPWNIIKSFRWRSAAKSIQDSSDPRPEVMLDLDQVSLGS